MPRQGARGTIATLYFLSSRNFTYSLRGAHGDRRGTRTAAAAGRPHGIPAAAWVGRQKSRAHVKPMNHRVPLGLGDASVAILHGTITRARIKKKNKERKRRKRRRTRARVFAAVNSGGPERVYRVASRRADSSRCSRVGGLRKRPRPRGGARDSG